ncbi:MAG: Grx4 family monothiol glutaredoxin [Myxococcota bacterium]
MDTSERIRGLIEQNEVLLFMKGNRNAPRCGFSARVIDILDQLVADYTTFDVLSDPSVRQGIKDFSQWPTIPQLYVKGEFVGGCDIVSEMMEQGELAKVLGVGEQQASAPELQVTDAALGAFESFFEGTGRPTVRIEVDRMFQCGMDFDTPRPSDFQIDLGRVLIVVDPASARRLTGSTVDYAEGAKGSGFKVDNPNEPPKVRELSVHDFAGWRESGKAMEVFDVRSADERALASISGARLLDEEGKAYLESLPKDTVLVFHCHHGGRSLAAAHQYIQTGFSHIYNLRGGIDAWSLEIDDSVPRY